MAMGPFLCNCYKRSVRDLVHKCHISTIFLVCDIYSTANIKALIGSLGALSVNKLSHIPKLQPISAVYENQ